MSTNNRHGLSYHPLYNTWREMLSRCSNPSNKRYEQYGLKGIKVSEDFKNIATYINYVENLPNAFKDNYSVDRINNSEGYRAGNLRWASKFIQNQNTTKLQVNNTSGYRGVTQLPSGNWQARIVANGKRTALGTFQHPWTAAYVYDSYVITNNLEHTTNFETM